MPAKLLMLCRLTPLEPYLAQVDMAALHNGWSCRETAIDMALTLEGPELQVFVEFSAEERRDLQTITDALDRQSRE